jgi:hypothetical protein
VLAQITTIATVLILFSAANMAVPPRLQVGDALPTLGGQTVSGAAAELPHSESCSASVLVFSFSRSGGLDARLWNERLEKDFGAFSEVSRCTVIMLESVPKLFRGAALSNIKSNIPKPLWGKTILVFKDEALWKSRLGFSTDNHCYVAALDKGGRIVWIGTGPFTDNAYAGLRRAVMGLMTTDKQGKEGRNDRDP